MERYRYINFSINYRLYYIQSYFLVIFYMLLISKGIEMRDKIQGLLKLAEEEQKKTSITPRKFKSTKGGKIILDPNKPFDNDWYENDRAYDL